ncbi:ABC transporter substrate-binding protein [Vibrio sp. S4M6]|uniref:substrate-binding periplasmic protein n=1 Tax=Vibrio sinus TaxID=2946865 RepID=UPI002029D17A|nr:ABC transporter substrate-binding protein [Vibrio sinus]MCL9782703.1 ABC transporter substrate-binding protein [Vibrio sinus]
MSANNLWTLLIFIAVLISVQFNARAELPKTDPWGELIFVTEDYPPLNYKDDNGHLTGLAVEVLLGAAKQANSALTASDIKLLPWARGYRMAENDANVVLFSTSRKPSRESLFLWAGPIVKGTPSVLLARKDRHIKVKEKSDLYNYRIGVIKGDSLENRVKALGGPEENIIKIHSGDLLAEQLEKGRIDLWAYNAQGAAKIFKSLGIAKNQFEIVFKFPFNDNYLAINKKTSPELVESLQQAIDKFRTTPEFQKLMEKYNHNMTVF